LSLEDFRDFTFIEQMEIDSGPGVIRWRIISSRFLRKPEVCREINGRQDKRSMRPRTNELREKLEGRNA